MLWVETTKAFCHGQQWQTLATPPYNQLLHQRGTLWNESGVFSDTCDSNPNLRKRGLEVYLSLHVTQWCCLKEAWSSVHWSSNGPTLGDPTVFHNLLTPVLSQLDGDCTIIQAESPCYFVRMEAHGRDEPGPLQEYHHGCVEGEQESQKTRVISGAQRSCSIEVDELLGDSPLYRKWKEWPQSTDHAKVRSRQMWEVRADQKIIATVLAFVAFFLNGEKEKEIHTPNIYTYIKSRSHIYAYICVGIWIKSIKKKC